jgi:outer membrane protein OmpA-like peptidoglycan-associated protein
MDVKDSFAYQVINRPVELSPIKVGQKITLKNIFFESGKSTLKTESKVELGKLKALMDKFPKLIVQINGHTDASGSDELNLKLSQQRADVVVKYLVDQGVDPKRLRSKGYGETQPIAINYNPDGTPNRAGMALNRRFEFEILSVDGILKDAVEKVEVPDKLKNH